MSYFAVIREAGPGWTDGKGAFGQPGANDHAAFMNQLADQGAVLFAGPLAHSQHGRIRVLLIANAHDEADIHRRLTDDPWVLTHKLVTTSIEPWTLLIGADRLPTAQAPQPVNN